MRDSSPAQRLRRLKRENPCAELLKDKHWELGRRIIVGGAACFLLTGICLGTGAAQVSSDTQASEPAASAAAAAYTDAGTKEEVVYAALSASGDVDAVYVVNHFVTAPGIQITDYGDYSEVANLTDTEPISLDGDTVTFTTATDSFYYQGNLASTKLPWDFTISYRLDGQTVAPAELAGATGDLEIHVRSRPDKSINSLFYDNYMLQIQITLDTALAKKVEAPGSIVASAGSSQVFSYTVLPGSDADFTLSAAVQDFEMTGISITGMPYSVDIEFPDVENTLTDLEKLPDAIAQLNDGVSKLESGTLDMRSGTEELVSGSAGIQSGLSLLSESSSSLRNGSGRIERALQQISSSLADSGLDDIDLSSIRDLPESLARLQSGLEGLSGGLAQLEGGFSMAYGALEQAIDSIPGPQVSQSEIESVMANLTEPEDLQTVGALAASYEAAQTVRGTFMEVGPAFAAVEPALSEVAGGIDQMSSQLGEALADMESELSGLDGLSQLRQLQYGLEELAGNYSDFNSGLSGYLSGVDKLSSNYAAFHSGIRSLSSGAGQLHAGVGELHEGTSTLNDEIADLPELIQAEIDKMKEEYLPTDFSPASFTSPENDETSFVQFVLQCDGIREPAGELGGTEETEEEEENFWDRLADLFS